MSYVEKAIGAAGMTKGAACEVMGMSRPTLDAKLRDTGQFTFGEIESLGNAMDEDARALLRKAVDEADAAATETRGIGEMRLGEYFAARKDAGRLDGELTAMYERVFA